MSAPLTIGVVGLGAAGLATAMAAARRGDRVIGWEQSDLDNQPASSGGRAKIIRFGYDDPFYADLMRDTLHRWESLAAETGRTLMDRHGGLHTGSTETIATVTGGIVAAGQPYEVVHPGDARLAAFGAVLGDHEPAVFEPAAGMMWPSQVRAALAEAARTAGAALYDHTTVTAIEPLPGDRVRVHVFDGHSGAGYTDCDRVVLAGGPWAFRLAPAAAPAFAITRRFQLICRTDEPLGDGRPRPWIDHAGVGYYGMINVQPRTHLVGLHELDREQPVADPGEPDDTAVRADSVAQSLEYAMHRFALSREPTVVEVRACHYTSTASRDFTIDDCPGLPGVILLSPCSGHGFKFTVTVGDYAVRLAHAEEFPHRSRFAVQLATMS